MDRSRFINNTRHHVPSPSRGGTGWGWGAFVCFCTAVLVVPARAEEAPPGVSLTLQAGRTTAYVGERIPVSATLRVSGATVRNVGYPEIEGNGLKAVKFDQPQQLQEPSGDGVVTVYRFTGTATATRPGSATLGPARITFDLLESAGSSAAFFGAVEPRKEIYQSGTVQLDVQSLPTKRRPGSFHGAVGTFTMSVRATPPLVVAGDPVTITTIIRGRGSLASATCPEVAAHGIKSYPVKPTHRVSELACQQAIIPETANSLPIIEWSYFDPESGAFNTLAARPGTTVVVKRTSAQRLLPVAPRAQTAAENRRVPLSTILLPLAFAAFILVAIPTVAKLRRRPTGTERSLLEPAILETMVCEAESAMAGPDVEKFYSCASRTLKLIISQRYGVIPESVSAIPSSCGLPARVGDVWSRCDAVLYGRQHVEAATMRQDLDILLMILSEYQRHPHAFCRNL